MAVTLQEFLGQVDKQGGIRTQNLFELYINTGYPEIDSALEKITMYGQGFEIPARNQEYNTVSFKGYDFKIPGKPSMTTEHEMTINADINGIIRRAFLAWQQKTTNFAISDGSFLEGDKTLHLGSTVRVHLLGNNGEVSEIVKLVGVKVANVGPLQVSNSEATVGTFTIQLISQYWEIENVAEGAFKDQK